MADHHSRRGFMGVTAAGAAAVLTPTWLRELPGAGSPGAAPDLIVHNASVYTMDPAMPRAQAFAVKGGRFVAIGSTAEIRALAGKGTESIDAKRMTVVPGFVDTHNH